MKYILPNFLYLTFLISACGSTKHEALEDQPFETIKIDLDRIQKVKMSAFFDDVEYIPLETEGIPLGRGNGRIYGDKFYFLERFSPTRLSVFDQEGNLNFMFDHGGRGSGEFLEASDFFVNKETGIIEILDNRGRKINMYDSLGEFIKNKPSKFLADSFIKHGHKYYMYTGVSSLSLMDNSSLAITDTIFEVQKTFFPIPKEMEKVGIGGYNNFHIYQESLFLTFPLNDTIFQITPSDEVLPKYVVDFGKHKLPSEIFEGDYKVVRDFINRVEKEGLVLGLGTSLQNEDWLLFNFRSFYKSSLMFEAFYSKKSRQVFYSFNIENDIDRGIFGRPFHINNDHLYVMIQPFELLQKIREEGTVVHKGTKLWELLQQVDENSNPVVMKCKFRNNNR